MVSVEFHQSTDALNKTSSHIYNDTNSLLQLAADRTAEARHIGSNRTKGYSSLIVVVVSIVFQWAGLFGLSLLKSTEPHTAWKGLTSGERMLVDTNLARILSNIETITNTKNRVAPAMPIDQNLSSIRSAAEDLKTVMAPPVMAPITEPATPIR